MKTILERLFDVFKFEIETLIDRIRNENWDFPPFFNLRDQIGEHKKGSNPFDDETKWHSYTNTDRERKKEYRHYTYTGSYRETKSRERIDYEKRIKRYYSLFDLQVGANIDAVKQAYREKVKKYHPDRFEGDEGKKKIANEVVLKLNEAYRELLKYLEKTNI